MLAFVLLISRLVLRRKRAGADRRDQRGKHKASSRHQPSGKGHELKLSTRRAELSTPCPASFFSSDETVLAGSIGDGHSSTPDAGKSSEVLTLLSHSA